MVKAAGLTAILLALPWAVLEAPEDPAPTEKVATVAPAPGAPPDVSAQKPQPPPAAHAPMVAVEALTGATEGTYAGVLTVTEDEQRAKGAQRQESLLGREFPARMVLPRSCHLTPTCSLSHPTFALFLPDEVVERTYAWSRTGDDLIGTFEKSVEDECVEGEDTVTGLVTMDITERVVLTNATRLADGTTLWREILIDYVEDARDGGGTGCEHIRYRAEGVLTRG